MRMIMCWQAENGEYYKDRSRAEANSSPDYELQAIWGESDPLKPCSYDSHSPECRGPGDVKHHVMPILKAQSISQLVGRLLSCCGDNVSSGRSCGCSHTARALVWKIKQNVLMFEEE